MRNLVFGGANSLDNFLARPDGAVDWLKWGPEAAEIMAAYWSSFDTILMGRKTYEVALRNGQANGYGDMPCFVFSRSLAPEVRGTLQILADDPVVFVRELKNQPGKDICLMGGGELACPLLEADLIDEIGFNIHPVLLGRGVPLFHPLRRQVDLELKECRPFKNGCVYVSYRVVHSASDSPS